MKKHFYRFMTHITTGKTNVFYKTKYAKIRQKQNNKEEYLAPNSCKRILVVNTDSIGDYILSRNFLTQLKKSEKYRGYEIHFMGCETHKKFAEYLDSDTIDKFLWVPNRPQERSEDELIQIKDALHHSGLRYCYDTIIFPSLNSVDKMRAHNLLTKNIKYRKKIILSNAARPNGKMQHLLNFTSVYVNNNASNMFDFDINKWFYENLLDKKIDLKYPVIENEKIIQNWEKFNWDWLKNQKSEYIVINPCAYDNYRKWHRNNWIEIIQYIKTKLGLDVVIACAKHEEEYCQEIANFCDTNITVMAGLSIDKLLMLLKMSKLYIGQDSGIFHVAAALDIRALCLSAGNAYFRFMNYPKYRKNIKVLFPKGVEEWINKNNDKKPEQVRRVDSFYINEIKTKYVKQEIEQLLNLREICFIHKLSTNNTGDKVICVYDYFKEYFDKFFVQKFDNEAMKYMAHKSNTVFIIGGGGIINQNNNWNKWINNLMTDSNKVIGWGIGFNQHYGSKIDIELNTQGFSILGIRDFNQPIRYVPCASCMGKALEKNAKTIRKVGCITHYANADHKFDCPTIYNNQDFHEIIKFISETDVIITNTYHAMYWSTLMGKKVILFDSFSNKFDNFKYKPKKYSGKLDDDIKNAKSYPNALAECRKINQEFFEEVKKIIEA